jgi:predicted O-methyltransferase YrrM
MDKNEKVTGWFSYEGITTQQHYDVGKFFNQLFNQTKPSRILEIGTAFGGLTLLLRNILDDLSFSTEIRTYDIDSKHYLQPYIDNGLKIDVRIKNIFNHEYSELTELDDISTYVQSEGVTIVLCDGGSKKNEFKILSSLLKPGDIIMAHDYSPNQTYFEENINNKIWNWLEIQDSDIDESCLTYNLKPYMEDEFRSVVWVCKIKE